MTTTVSRAGPGGLLSNLDQKVPTSFYWSLTLLATIGGFLFGYDTANIGSALPTAIRGRAAAIGATADWLANFAVILVFPIASAAIGLAWVMVGFAVLAVLAILFVAGFLPETKHLSVEEITEVFERQAREGPRGMRPTPSGT